MAPRAVNAMSIEIATDRPFPAMSGFIPLIIIRGNISKTGPIWLQEGRKILIIVRRLIAAFGQVRLVASPCSLPQRLFSRSPGIAHIAIMASEFSGKTSLDSDCCRSVFSSPLFLRECGASANFPKIAVGGRHRFWQADLTSMAT